MNAALLFAKKKNLIKSTDSYEKNLERWLEQVYRLYKKVLG